MKPFDLKTAPLKGITLIEAGAGTGKTYTLAGIFLRLIVEHGLGIDRILVVTYTKAATEELKTRIRNRLLDAKAAFSDLPAADEFLDHLACQFVDKNLALQRIEDALTDFDRAAIYTIHGFCQRLLQHFAFETGHMFHSELVQDQQALVLEVADDFWRRHISTAPYELSHYALATLKSPEQLAALLINYCRYPYVTVLPPPIKPPLKAVAPWRQAADRLSQLWSQEKEKILNLLLDPGLNARFFGKCEPDPQQPGFSQRRIRLTALAEDMDLWNGKYPLFEKAERFSTAFLEKATKKNHVTPQNPFFDVCQTAVTIHARMVDQLAAYIRYLKIRLQAETRQRLDRKKVRQNILFFDDLLLHVHDALKGRRGQELVRAVRRQYKAALVDEFQDTDPLQYDIFQRLFDSASDLLVMIGDPKQAIYSFRGADIFSYLKAAESAQTNSTLTRNWRSTPTLVRAVNTIFESRGRPFGFEKIKFNHATAAHPEPSEGDWPLKLWCLTRSKDDSSEKPINQETAVSAIAVAVAEEIVRLTAEPALGIAPSQIAVLTRTHRQLRWFPRFCTAPEVYSTPWKQRRYSE
jgi:exodeoxyribonuclease V beta subunit